MTEQKHIIWSSDPDYEDWRGDLISNYFGNITLADLARPDQAGNDYVI